jgi:hypothetical protein
MEFLFVISVFLNILLTGFLYARGKDAKEANALTADLLANMEMLLVDRGKMVTVTLEDGSEMKVHEHNLCCKEH